MPKSELSVTEIISNTAPPYALGFETIPLFILIVRFNDILLTVMSIFSEPVYENGQIPVSYIAKNTCCRDVIVPRYELALYTPCNVYPLLALFEINYKLQSLTVFSFIV